MLPDPRDELIAIELARGARREAAARVAGVCVRTVYSRLREPWFTRRVAELQREMLTRTVAKLAHGSEEAVDILLALARDGKVDPKVRGECARGLLTLLKPVANLAVHGEEIRALQERLDAVQQRQESKTKRIGSRPHIRVDRLPEP
jgi:hypothetical protein